MKTLKSSKGFTLIEIIAVLVVLGVLAAVAVPKYIDLQNDAKKKAAVGFVAAAQSAISMGYAANLLGNATPAGPSAACNDVKVECADGSTCTVSCSGDDWTVANSTITAKYGDQSVTGTWTKP